MFAPLPTGFAKLAQAVEALRKFSLPPPPAMVDLGTRLRRLFAQARPQGYQGLSRNAIRRLPYALWLPGQASLATLEPGLVEDYWSKHLHQAAQQPRAAKRWLTPLFYVYCHCFDKASPEFQDFAQRIRRLLPMAAGPLGERLRAYHDDFRWFAPADVGIYLGKRFAESSAELPAIVEELNLWPGFLAEPIGAEAFAGALRAPSDVLARVPVVDRMKAWGTGDRLAAARKPSLRYPSHRVALAEGLVRPWLQRMPPDNPRNGLTAFLVNHYGDPRIVSDANPGHGWQGVGAPTINTVRRWLVGDTLRGFTRILQLTADEIWHYRERFWMAYYEHGVIEEAWLVLGTRAIAMARQNFARAEWAQFGALVSGATSDQSVLFLRIGHLVFMEWSHNGSLRACVEGDRSAPAMYQAEYHGDRLRDVISLDFHGGMNLNPELRHVHSDKGTWQRKARDFIADQTGVTLSDQAILP